MPRVLDRNGLRDLGVCLSNTHMLRLESRGRFPKRVYLSPQKVVWLESEVSEWLEDRIQKRSKNPNKDEENV